MCSLIQTPEYRKNEQISFVRVKNLIKRIYYYLLLLWYFYSTWKKVNVINFL